VTLIKARELCPSLSPSGKGSLGYKAALEFSRAFVALWVGSALLAWGRWETQSPFLLPAPQLQPSPPGFPDGDSVPFSSR